MIKEIKGHKFLVEDLRDPPPYVNTNYINDPFIYYCICNICKIKIYTTEDFLLGMIYGDMDSYEFNTEDLYSCNDIIVKDIIE